MLTLTIILTFLNIYLCVLFTNLGFFHIKNGGDVKIIFGNLIAAVINVMCAGVGFSTILQKFL